MYDPEQTEPWLLEKKDTSTFSFEKDAFTLSLNEIKAFLQGLDELVHKHRDVEYVPAL